MSKTAIFLLVLLTTGLDGLFAGNNIFQDLFLRGSAETYLPKDLIVSRSRRAQMVFAANSTNRHALFVKSPQMDYFQLVIKEEELQREITNFLFVGNKITWVPNAFCSDLACYFSTYGPNTASWKISFDNLIPRKIIYSGQTTNLGKIREVKSLFPSLGGDREFAKIKLESGQEGYYELKTDGQFTLTVEAEAGSRWAAMTDSSLVYTSITRTGGASYLELKETGLTTKKTAAFTRNSERFGGAMVSQCCEVKASGQDFIFSFIGRENGKAVVFFADRDRKMTKIWDAGKNLGSSGVLTENGPPLEFSYQLQHSYNGQTWTVAGLLNGASTILSFAAPTSNSFRTILNDSDGSLKLKRYSNPFETEYGEVVLVAEDATGTSIKRGVRPIITDFSPKLFGAGDVMTLTGRNLGEPWFQTTVIINKIPVSLHPADIKPGSVSFVIPEWPPYEDLTATVKITNLSSGTWAEDNILLQKSTLPPQPPIIQNGGIVNAANFKASGLAPGMLTTIFGQNLTVSSNSGSARSFPLPTTLANTSVLINGRLASLLYVGEYQINFQVPTELVVGPQATVKVITKTSDGTTLESPEVRIGTATTAPALFEYLGTPIVTDHNGNLSPLKPLDDGYYYAILWANGFGDTMPAVASGQPAPSEPLAIAKAVATAKVGNDDAEVLFCGLSPGFAGLYQVNIRFKPTGPPSNQGVLNIGSFNINFNLTY